MENLLQFRCLVIIMEAVSPANLPKTNKALVLFLAVLQLILFVVYGIFVNPLNIPTLGLFEWLTLITIVASVGIWSLTQVISTSTITNDSSYLTSSATG
jgi:hypothetical protein